MLVNILRHTREVRYGSLRVHIEVFRAVSCTDRGFWLQGLIIWCSWLQSQHLESQLLSAEANIIRISENTHNSVKAFCKFSASFLQNRTNVNTVVHLQYKSFTVDVTFAEHFKCSDCIYFSFCRLSICSVNTLSSCCMAACWCSEISEKESAPSSPPLSSITASVTEGSRGLTGGEGVW